jgi:uncharacterized OsmC-like protein
MENGRFEVKLRLDSGYAFDAEFPDLDVPGLRLDEPVPLGQGSGPNAARVLASAVAHCLSASLLFCLRKARIEVHEMDAAVEGELVRNERGRMRLGRLRVRLEPTVAVEPERLARCLELFEDFCVVTESVRHGLDVEVEVQPVEALAGAGRG